MATNKTLRVEVFQTHSGMHEADRIDAARWRALLPLLRLEGRLGETRIVSRRFPIYLDTVEQCVDKMIEQGHP